MFNLFQMLQNGDVLHWVHFRLYRRILDLLGGERDAGVVERAGGGVGGGPLWAHNTAGAGGKSALIYRFFYEYCTVV